MFWEQLVEFFVYFVSHKMPRYIRRENYDPVPDEQSMVSLNSAERDIPDQRLFYFVWQGLRDSFLMLCTVLLILMPIFILFIVFDAETIDKCLGIQSYNVTIPHKVWKWRLAGESIQAILLNLWFPLTMWLLFAQTRLSAFGIGLLMGLFVVTYKTCLFLLDHRMTRMEDKHRYPGNGIFFIGVILISIVIAAWRQRSWPKTILKIGLPAIFSLAMAMLYRYLIVPLFNDQTDESKRALVALIPSLIAILPIAVSKYVVLQHGEDLGIDKERSYILVYFNYCVPVALYRIMQANLDDLKWYIAFSVVRDVWNFGVQNTRFKREDLWTKFANRIQDHGGTVVPYRTPHNRQLQADLEIQDILFQYSTIILSQVYIVVYNYSTFDVPLNEEVGKAAVRASIGLLIELVFTWLCISVQIYRNDRVIHEVLSHKSLVIRHVAATALILIISIIYFSHVLLSVFHRRMQSTMETYSVRNCTTPFT